MSLQSPSLSTCRAQQGACWALGQEQAQAGECAGSAPALPPHISRTLHRPAHGQAASTGFFVPSRGGLHFPRTLEKELSLSGFQAHWWGKARNTTLGWILLPQPQSVWAACLPTTYLLLGLVREGFAGPLLPDLALSPTPRSNTRGKAHTVSLTQRRSSEYSNTPQLRLPLGKEAPVLCKRVVGTTDLLISVNVSKMYPATSVFSPAPKKTRVSSKAQPHQHIVCCLGNLNVKD